MNSAVYELPAALGAEICGVRLNDMDDPRFRDLEAALFRHKVIFLRDQDPSFAEQEALIRHFGEHGVDAFTDGVEGYDAIQRVVKG